MLFFFASITSPIVKGVVNVFNNKEKVALFITGLELVGCIIFTIYCYGKSQYYKGRVERYEELKPIIENQQQLL